MQKICDKPMRYSKKKRILSCGMLITRDNSFKEKLATLKNIGNCVENHTEDCRCKKLRNAPCISGEKNCVQENWQHC